MSEASSPSDGRDVAAVFVMGKGRSGSTVLDMLLGHVAGVFGAGELLYLWDWGLKRGISCGCGKDVLDCEVWSAVLADGFGIRSRTMNSEQIEEIWRAYRKVARWAYAPRLMLRREVGRWDELRVYATATEQLFRSIADVTGANVVVDSSKIPVNPAALGLVGGINGRVLHLVRDPRAVAHSWTRRKAWTDRDGEAEMPTYGWLHTAASWTARNLGAELVARRWDISTRLRYEDLTASPLEEFSRVLAALDLPADTSAFVDDRTVRMVPNHTVGGNPDRFTTGTIEIRPDDEWARQPPTLQRRALALATAPLRRRYRY